MAVLPMICGITGGDVAELGVWSCIAPAGMIAALAAGYSPLFFSDNRQAYIPVVRDNLERLTGTDGTLDGTTVSVHPPVIYPSSQSFVFTPATITEQTWIERRSRFPRFSNIRR